MTTHTWLSGLLALQLLLAGGLMANARHQRTQNTQQRPLLTLQTSTLEELTMESSSQKTHLTKVDGQWRVPAQENLPADQNKVQNLLSQLDSLRKGWPVAHRANSHERFEVANNKHKIKLALKSQDGTLQELLLGTSTGLRKTHLRALPEDAVYSLDLNSYDVPCNELAWLDKDLIRVKGVKLIKGPDYELELKEDQWSLLESNGELRQDKAKALAESFRTLRYAKPAQGELPSERVAIEVTGSEGSWTFQFAQKDGKFFVKRSDRDQVFELAKAYYHKIVDISPKELLEQ